MAATGALGNRVWNDTDGDGIQDLSELGIDDITVNLYSDDNADGVFDNLVNTTTTDAYGNYIFDGLAPDAYVIELLQTDLTSAGFTNAATADPDGDGTNISEPIIIAPGDGYLNADFGYQHTAGLADIGDQIFIDVNSNNAFDLGTDVGMAGVSVALVVDGNGNGIWENGEEVAATTVTAFDGSYLFKDVPAGDYIVAVTDTDNILGEFENSFDADGGNDGFSGITMAAADILTQDFAYIPKGHESGKGLIGDFIFLDANANNAYTTGEAGIEGVEVQLLDGVTDEVLATTTTNELGFYFFGNLEADDYKVKVETTSLPTGLTNNVDPDGVGGDNISNSFSLAAGATDLTKNFVYKAITPRTIAGTLWEDTDGDGTKDAAETARFQNVSVLLRDANGNIIGVAATDANGDYSFAGIPDGANYTVEVQDVHGYMNGFWNTQGTDGEQNPKSIALAGANVSGVDFGFYKEGAALGNLVWEDDGDGLQEAGETGIEGTIVTLEIDYNNDGTTDVTVVDTTNADGFYSFENLLMDEDYISNNNTGGPEYTISVATPSGYILTTNDVNANVNDQEDSDNPTGAIIADGTLLQGQKDVATNADPTLETLVASYDFGFVSTNLILPINDTENTLENIAVSGNILTNDFDPESDNITLTGIEDPTNLGTYVNSGTLTTIPGTDEDGSPVADAGDLTINTDGTYTFTPANNFTGKIELPYQVIDDNDSPKSEDATLTIIVTGEPDVTVDTDNVTVANNDENITYENVPVSGNVMLNDADPTMDNLTFDGFDDGGFPANFVNTGALNDVSGNDLDGNVVSNAGDFIISADGSYTFTPETGFTGTVKAPYQIYDDATEQDSAIAILTITVLPDYIPSNNDKPFAADDFSSTVLNTSVAGDFITNDNDPNANSVSFMGTTINPLVGSPSAIGTYPTQQGGTIQMFDDGTYIYTPALDYSGPDNFKYQICDVTATAPQPLCDSATINMTVFPLYRDFSDMDNSIYTDAYHWGAEDANSDKIPDATDAFWFGSMVDYETTDLTSTMGDGDDTDGVNDDDGLATPATLPVGNTETFTTTVNSNTATTVHFGIWIDWDANGTIDSFYVNSGTTDGVNALDVNTTINVPSTYGGGNVYIRQRAFNNAPTFADFGGNSLNGEVEDYVLSFIALPVELLSFSGKVEDCMTSLAWATASEDRFDYFEVQWSGDGYKFQPLQIVKGEGAINGAKYFYKDTKASPTNYYRLKMVDLDDSFEYSKVISLNTDCDDPNDLTIYPNPMTKELGVVNLAFYSEKPETQFVLIDGLGRIVKRLTVEAETSIVNKMQWDVSDLPSGTYHLQQVGTRNAKIFMIQE